MYKECVNDYHMKKTIQAQLQKAYHGCTEKTKNRSVTSHSQFVSSAVKNKRWMKWALQEQKKSLVVKTEGNHAQDWISLWKDKGWNHFDIVSIKYKMYQSTQKLEFFPRQFIVTMSVMLPKKKHCLN